MRNRSICKIYVAAPLSVLLLLMTCCSEFPAQQAVSEAVKEEQTRVPSHEGSTVFILRHDGAESSVTHMGALRFKGYLEAESGGAIHVDIYPASELGSIADTEYALRYGNITMHIGEPLYQVMQCLSWTAIGGDLDEYRQQIRSGEARRLIDEECAANGVVFLGSISDEYLLLSSANPITGIEDFADLRIASAQAAKTRAFWEPLGATLVKSPRKQIFTAIQQSVVNAQEDTMQNNLVTQISRYHPYITQLRHRISSRAVYINRKSFTDLSPEQQQMIEDAVIHVQQYLAEYLDSTYAENIRLLEENGIAVSEAPPELQEQIRDAAEEPFLDNLRQQLGDDLVDAILAVRQE